ncbi:hypothetical protein [Niveispirillum irakense]|uniref:hypothetical protein n=1 Tax=Niveispirillum irakense TaxID=34011 RepID=UPI0012B5DBD9|nr:hypothetical protein [Niveispirillum irakense]
MNEKSKYLSILIAKNNKDISLNEIIQAELDDISKIIFAIVKNNEENSHNYIFLFDEKGNKLSKNLSAPKGYIIYYLEKNSGIVNIICNEINPSTHWQDWRFQLRGVDHEFVKLGPSY